MGTENIDGLAELLLRYREACPEVEPSAAFMPNLWRKIEQRQSFAFAFQKLARAGMLAAAVLSFLLLILNVATTRPTAQTYTDALMADHTAEKTYYTEAIRSAPTSDEAPVELRH
jgi:hypothetical protein